jgi:N-acetylglucosamine-6-phosphate deacetylase
LARRYILRARRVLTPLEEIGDGAVVVSDGVIQFVGPASAVGNAVGATRVDCGDGTIVPGFVDVHIHGSGGSSAMDGASAVARVATFITASGVTSWLPTLTPRGSIAEMREIIRESLDGAQKVEDGAEILGLHLEGPYLSPKRPGAIRAEWFRGPSITEAEALLEAGAGRVRLMTLAPELPGGLDLVRYLVARNVVASIGHSDAGHGQTLAAVELGLSHATHTFNAMRGFQHRDPGVVGAVLTTDAINGELIADGVHVDPLAMRLLIRTKGEYRVLLITDAVAPAGLGDGTFDFEGRPITVRNGRATLVDGTIAGSVATFDENLRRVVRDAGVSLRAAVVMATLAPARAIRAADRKGMLAGGRDADLAVLDPNLTVRLTMARGRIVYDRLEG